MKKFKSFLLLATALLIFSCDSDEDPNVVGAKGGTITSTDGVASIAIPAGALSANTKISVEETNSHPSHNVGNVYDFGPDGTQFSFPATISFSYDPADVTGFESDLRIVYAESNTWKIIPSTVDETNNKVSAQVNHFTTFSIGTLPADSLILTTWDVTINYSTTLSWHADVTFYADGTTKYDEPEFPGLYLNHGVWTLNGNAVHWNIGVAGPNYIYDGTINTDTHTMSGTSTTGTWSAVMK